MRMLPIQQLKVYLGTLHGVADTPRGWDYLKCLVDIFCLAQMRDWYEEKKAYALASDTTNDFLAERAGR